MMRTRVCSFLLAVSTLIPPLRADTVVHWGEFSGVNPGGTNIVTANQNLVGAGTTYSGVTNNPAVGASYYPDAADRSPWFSAASSATGTRMVEQATSGDRLTMYGSANSGGTYRGMYLWHSNYFLSVDYPFALTNVSVVINQRSNANSTNQAVRIIVQQGGQYYATQSRSFGAQATTNLFALESESWYSFSPFSGGSETIGGSVAPPSLTNVQSVGCYFSVQNGGASSANTGGQVWHMRAEGRPVAAGPALYSFNAVSQNPTWGSVSPTGGVYEAGSEIVVTATASNYYEFSAWSGAYAGPMNPVSLIATSDLSIAANFVERMATNNTPQWWLASFGLATDDGGALSDFDLDGRPAWQEYQGGTDPTISNSFTVTTARNVRLVDFGAKLGSGFYRGQSAPRSYTALHDEDQNGTLTNDTVRAWIFSTNLALNPPGLEYDTNSPNGVFYGGLSIFAVNNPDRSLSEGLLNQNHEFMDDANVMGLGDIIPGERFSAYAVFFWQKQNFLNGGDEYNVRFDTNSTITAHISRYWGGVNAGRWLVREGDQFYLSQATFAGRTNQYDLYTTNRVDDPGHGAENPVTRRSHTLNPHSTLWALYQPGPAPGTNDDFEIGFHAGDAAFSARVFSNVTAVGFFIERELSEPKLVWTGLLPNQPMGVKWNAFQCNAIVEGSQASAHHIAMATVLDEASYLASNAIPYDVWRRMYRHMVRRQYPRDLGPLTYSLERDGSMGTMRVDDAAHAGVEPVRDITWLDAIAFCNGLSEMEGREPCYYSDATMTNVLRIVVDRDMVEAWDARPTVYWKTAADGFRLPTIAEWDDTPIAMRDTNAWEFVWHLSGTVADSSVATVRTVRGWGLVPPALSSGPFSERPWYGSSRIGFRVALNGSQLPDPSASGGGASEWSFHAATVLPAATTSSIAALRAEVESLCTFTSLVAGLAQTSHAADTNFNPGAVITNAPYALDIAQTEIPFHLWRLVQEWAKDNGYRFNYDGDMGSMGNTPGDTLHTNTEPVTQISLYDTYAWCNAMSELMGLTPVYFLDAAFTQPYREANQFRLETLKREGSPNWPGGPVFPYDTAALIPVFMNVTNAGYRLLLPQEWNLVNITNTQTADPAYNWLAGNAGGKTQPVGALLPNPLGLHDMNGNVLELTWGSTKATLVGGNIPFRQGSHFARTYRNNTAKSPDWGEFSGVGRNHVGFRIAIRPSDASTNAAPAFTLSVLANQATWGEVSPTGGVYATGAVVQVTASEASGFHFVEWTGDATGGANPLSVTMDGNKVLVANFATNETPPATTNLLIVASAYGSPSPAGSTLYTNGAVVSASVGGSPIDQGTTQWVATGWTMNGNHPGSGSVTNVDITLTNNATLTWLWQTQVLLQASAGANGSVNSTGGWFALGGGVTVTATADNGYAFAGWAGDISGDTNSNPLNLTMDRARSITANFGTNDSSGGAALAWRVDFNGSGNDTLAISNFTGWTISSANRTQSFANVDGGSASSSITVRLQGTGTFNSYQRTMNAGSATNLYRDGGQSTGSPVILSITNLAPGAAYRLRIWYFDDEFSLGGTQTYVNVTDGGNTVLGALTNTPTASAANGHATLPAGLYDSRYVLAADVTAGGGGTLDISLTPNTGNTKFNAFELTGQASSPPASYSLTIASLYGMATPAGTQSYPAGTSVNGFITNSPLTQGATQFIATGWTGTGSAPASGSGTGVSFTITSDSSVTWQWQTNHLLQAQASPNGTLSTTGGWHRSLSNATITATPAPGYQFAGWTGSVASTANPLILSMDVPRSVWATFEEDSGSTNQSSGDSGNVFLVNFGAKLGTGYYRNQSAPRSYAPQHDEDGNGTLTNDTVRAWIFSTNTPLNAPGLEYDTNSPNGVFYGGLSLFAVNNANRTLTEGLVNQNHEFSDDLNMMGLGDIVEGEQFSAYGVWFWPKEEFINGGEEHTVRFDTNSTIAVHISRYWGGVNAGRWLVRQGGQFYLSQATFAGRTNSYDVTTTNRVEDPGDGANNPVVRTTHILTPSATLWASYHPGPAPGTNDDTEIGFDADSATFSAVPFTNVTAVGFFVERRLAPPVRIAGGLLPNQPMGVKWNAFRCTAIVERPDTPSYHIATTPILDGDTFLASNAVSYATWREIFRHMVRRQYPRDLGPLTYSLERNGAMGTMRIDQVAHAGDEPVRDITWLDAIAFCNGLSEVEGREPCYYTDAAMTNVLRIVLDRDTIATWTNRPAVYWKTAASGFRLPTTAEWDAAPPALQETNGWEYVWHASGTLVDPSTHTTRTVRSWGLTAPDSGIGRFMERPWQGSARIGFRVALNGTNQPNPGAAAGAASTWSFHDQTVLAPATTTDVSVLRAEASGLLSVTNLLVGLALPSHAADTNFVPSATITNTPYPLLVGKTEVSFRLWNLAQGWGRDHGYGFNYDGDMGSMGNRPSVALHTNTEPVTQISLYDAYAWCNALSELMGRQPVYFLDAGLTQVYRQANLFRLETLKRDTSPNWPGGALTPYDTAALIPVFMAVSNNGYRLLLPQEWRLANATNATTADPAYNWLIGNSNGKTQPVGTLLPNALGLHDMEGNVLELTWGSTKNSINDAPFRMGGHFARASLIGKNPAHSAEFAGVGRTHVGFRIAALPDEPTTTFPLSVRTTDTGRGAVSPTGGAYIAGTLVEVSAWASNYYHFTAWTGDVTGADTMISFMVTNGMDIWAVFSENLATNGVPHWWLAGNGLGTNDSDALSDSDGDRVPAWQEYWAGTDPGDVHSLLSITNEIAVSAGPVLRWPIVSNRTYTVTRSTNMTGPVVFTPIASGLTQGVYTDLIQAVDHQGYYQIEVEIP